MTAEELGQMIWNVKELLRNVYDNKDVEDVILPFTLLIWKKKYDRHVTSQKYD